MNEEALRLILLVEDSPGDVRLTQEAFLQENKYVRLHVATDGVEAMTYLRREGSHVNASRPDLVLLDLNMPRMDGRQLLARVKEDEALRSIPIVILTTSTAGEDIARSYELQASCYLSKPVELDQFEELVRSINEFWLHKATLPPQLASRERN